jgi:hypothetical protein
MDRSNGFVRAAHLKHVTNRQPGESLGELSLSRLNTRSRLVRDDVVVVASQLKIEARDFRLVSKY